MKWYDRQKQLYAQKKQEEEVEQNTYTSTYTQPQDVAVEQKDNVTDEVEYQEENEEPVMNEERNTYEDEYKNQQVDDIMDELTDAYQTAPESSTINPVLSEDATTLSKGTLITGNIETDGDLIIHGHIKGDIICNSNLSVFGVIEGTINCYNAYFDNAIIIGDTLCSGNLQISESSTLTGNVEAYELLNGGRIKGNAVVGEGVRFLSTSAIVGDVSANDIEIERGAVIQGNVTIRQEVYFEEN